MRQNDWQLLKTRKFNISFNCIALSKLARKCCEVKGRNLESEGLVLTAVGFAGGIGHDNLISISLSTF